MKQLTVREQIEQRNVDQDPMKLCSLCLESTYWPFPTKDSHKILGLHFTLGKTWRPEKGHKDYELHVRLLKIL